MPFIKFTATPELPHDIAHLAYKAGDEVGPLSEASARRWIRRGVAEYYVPVAKELPRMGDGMRSDGPTVEEYVAAGYVARSYPPSGYASRSTDEEIATAIAAQEAPPEVPELSAPELETPELDTPELETPELETPELDNKPRRGRKPKSAE